MGTENKAKAPAATADVAQLEAETQDEIEKIMNEIESLQQEMDSVDEGTAPKLAPASAVPPSVAPPSAAPPAKPKPTLSAVPKAPPAAAAISVDEAELESFDSIDGNVEGAMAEETMANLNKSKSILDQAFDPEYGPIEETPVEEAPVEGLDAIEEMPAPAEEAEPMESLAEALPEPETGSEALADLDLGEEPHEAPVTEEEIEESVENLVDDIEKNLERELDESNASSSSSPGDGAMSMKITGKMTLKLQYDYEGQQATVTFGNDAICVELSDGTEVKIPVRRKGLKKVA